MPLAGHQSDFDLFGAISAPQRPKAGRRPSQTRGGVVKTDEFRELLAARFATLVSSTEDAIEDLRGMLACVDGGDNVSQIDHAIECFDDDLTEALHEFRREFRLW